MAEAAFGAINLELHDGTHPRLGVVDDILFHPLANASLDEAAWFAKSVAADFGNRLNGKSIKDTLFFFVCLILDIFTLSYKLLFNHIHLKLSFIY